MSFSPHKAWKRLSRMSWDEIRTRLGQEFGKRTDYALSRAGFPVGRTEILLGDSPTGNFFFSPEEVPQRIALLKQHLPAVEEQIVAEADEILEHRFRLLGYRDLDYGAEIDWHLDRVHGKRAPLKPWYKIHFLDFAEVGDHKITWELSRHQHFVTLAKAWAFTHDEKYLGELSRQFYSWQESNPYPMGINWGSSLEAAFRSLSWLWARHLTAAARAIDPGFERDLLYALALHGRHIERHLSTYFSPNTHLIGEAVALFFIGTLCGNLPQARNWQHQGLAIVLAEAERQVRPDGVYFEQSLYYHVYALDFFLHTRVLAARNQIPLPSHFDAILRRMLEVVRVLSRNSVPEGFGDDDGGRLFNPRRNHARDLSDPLALGSVLGDDAFAADITEEAVWLLGEPVVAAPTSPPAAVSSVAFRDGGLYVVASEKPQAAQMLVDAGPHGIGHGGHGHADALSVRFSSAGRVWLVDPGSYAYISLTNERDRFRGTAAHNTLSVDHLDQAVADGPFAWRFLPTVEVERWETGSVFTLLEASHTGYQRLTDPVKHRRSILHWHGDYWLVRDRAEGASAHQLEIYWHFAPDLRVLTRKNAMVAASPAGEQLTLLSSSPGVWDVKVEPGFVSPAYGEKQPAPIGSFSARLELPIEHATLIVAGAAGDAARFEMAEESVPGVTRYVYRNGGTSDSIVFGNGGQWGFGQVRSDAAFLFLRREHDEIESLAFCSASFVELDRHPVFRAPKSISWLDWTRRSGAVASDPQSLKFFRQEILWPGTPVP